jgi:O-palmitoleoyl-L-serine hydrolase
MYANGLLRALLCSVLFAAVRAAMRSPDAALQLLDASSYPHAKCLDGTPGGFYISLDDSNEGDTWVFMLQGGGECVDESSCKARAKTKLGTSSRMDNKTYFNYGIMNTRATQNPHFYNANYVKVAYCTGDLHMGTVSSPDSSTYGLYFSGAHIVTAVVDTLLKRYGLGTAAHIVLAGQSAGGLGIVSLLDRVALQIKTSGSKAAIVGAPEGGYYFLNDHTYHGPNPKPSNFIPWGTNHFPIYYKLWHAEVNEKCAEHYSDSPWRCLVADYSFPFIETPIFITEALTDRVVIPLHNGIPSKFPPFTGDEVPFVKGWGKTMRSALQQVLRSPTAGVFAPACWTHTTFDTGILLNGTDRLTYLANWMYNGQAAKAIDPCGDYLCNKHCPTFPHRAGREKRAVL